MSLSDTVSSLIFGYGRDIITAVVVFIVAAAVFSFLQQWLVTRVERFSEKTKNKIDDALVAMVKSIKPSFYWFLAFYLALRTLPLPVVVNTTLNGLLLALVIWYALRAAGIAVDMQLSHGAADAGEQSARRFLGTLIKGTLWVVAILLFLSNLGINITSLITGLGIGGVAVAFALQNILTDLFSSFAIYFDKPFIVGDFIIVGNQVGTVEKIGIKTTRLRALQGEEIVISNRELTSAHIQNFHSMQERRIETHIGIEYDTPREVVAGLPAKIRAVLDAVEGVRVDRVHFASFLDSSLDFDIVYYVPSGDYTEYMDRQQEINLNIMELFEKEGVSFAFPTQTIHVAKDNATAKQ